MTRRCLLLGGRPGSGKTHYASTSGLPLLPLDAFFRPRSPDLPRWFGDVDWNTVGAFDVDAAAKAVADAIVRGEVEFPVYDLSADQVVGGRRLHLGADEAFIAEGVFAGPVFGALPSELQTFVMPVYLDHGRLRSTLARMRGDREERRLSIQRSIAVSIRLAIREPSEFGPIEGARRVSRADLPGLISKACASSPFD